MKNEKRQVKDLPLFYYDYFVLHAFLFQGANWIKAQRAFPLYFTMAAPALAT
jgi:hypothetical protein